MISDPIGTVRREDHKPGPGNSIFVRLDPGYPDNEFADTEWTCIYSTEPGSIGQRTGESICAVSKIIGVVPGSPAYTGTDVEEGDKVLVTQDDNVNPVPARVVRIHEPNRWRDQRSFVLAFITPSHPEGEVALDGFFRCHFALLGAED